MIQAAFTIVGGIIGICFIVILLGCFLFTVQYIWMYHCHKCPHCGKYMEFRGLKEDEDNGNFLFHCPKCGAWEQVPREEFLRNSE